MNQWRVTVTYEARITAPTAEEAAEFAVEEVDAGLWPVVTTDTERIHSDDRDD